MTFDEWFERYKNQYGNIPIEFEPILKEYCLHVYNFQQLHINDLRNMIIKRQDDVIRYRQSLKHLQKHIEDILEITGLPKVDLS